MWGCQGGIKGAAGECPLLAESCLKRGGRRFSELHNRLMKCSVNPVRCATLQLLLRVGRDAAVGSASGPSVLGTSLSAVRCRNPSFTPTSFHATLSHSVPGDVFLHGL